MFQEGIILSFLYFKFFPFFFFFLFPSFFFVILENSQINPSLERGGKKVESAEVGVVGKEEKEEPIVSGQRLNFEEKW